jgi:hypothetical protein
MWWRNTALGTILLCSADIHSWNHEKLKKGYREYYLNCCLLYREYYLNCCFSWAGTRFWWLLDDHHIHFTCLRGFAIGSTLDALLMYIGLWKQDKLPNSFSFFAVLVLKGRKGCRFFYEFLRCCLCTMWFRSSLFLCFSIKCGVAWEYMAETYVLAMVLELEVELGPNWGHSDVDLDNMDFSWQQVDCAMVIEKKYNWYLCDPQGHCQSRHWAITSQLLSNQWSLLCMTSEHVFPDTECSLGFLCVLKMCVNSHGLWLQLGFYQ